MKDKQLHDFMKGKKIYQPLGHFQIYIFQFIFLIHFLKLKRNVDKWYQGCHGI